MVQCFMKLLPEQASLTLAQEEEYVLSSVSQIPQENTPKTVTKPKNKKKFVKTSNHKATLYNPFQAITATAGMVLKPLAEQIGGRQSARRKL